MNARSHCMLLHGTTGVDDRNQARTTITFPFPMDTDRQTDWERWRRHAPFLPPGMESYIADAPGHVISDETNRSLVRFFPISRRGRSVMSTGKHPAESADM